ncbi:MAG TPA: GIY-YIG nuclease family protein [Candidatus Portnoybacteria bacterium]|jgi:putative endonuclease|nr:GIY-YIG nuclease family protein [Candidatus Portnoybacteria bacterium]
MEYYTYIIKSRKNNKHYIGQTNNIKDRIKRHNNGESLSTKFGVPWTLIHFEKFKNRSEAVKRERYLKSLKNKNYIEKFIIAG